MTTTRTFDDITREELDLSTRCSPPVQAILQRLRVVVDGHDRASRELGTSKQRGLIAHEATDLTPDAKYEWYAVVRRLGLTRRHLGHIIQRAKEAPPPQNTEPNAEPSTLIPQFFVTD